MSKALLNFEDIARTYISQMPTKQLELLKLRKWTPLMEDADITKECAYLIGKIMGDGHLSKSFNLSFIGQKGDLNNLKRLLVNRYEIEQNRFSIRLRKARGISYALSVRDCLLGRFLFVLGAPKGNKTLYPFLVPLWIIKSKENSKFFLQGLLEDELTTIKIKKCNYSITPKLKLSKREHLLSNLEDFLTQIKFMLERINITCGSISLSNSKYDQKTKDLYFYIDGNKDNVLRFARFVGFRLNKNKVHHLNECAHVLDQTRLNRKPVIDVDKVIELRSRGLSIRQISKRLNLKKDSVHKVIIKAKNAGKGIRTPEHTK